MKLITFDVFRTLGIPGVRYITPDHMFDHLEEIRQADWLLFPEYWQINSLLYGLGARIFPSPASYYLGHDKVEQARAFLALCPEHRPGHPARAARQRRRSCPGRRAAAAPQRLNRGRPLSRP